MRQRRYMVLIRNDQGRPCAWGAADTTAAAWEEAERQWKAYRRDPGEYRGRADAFEYPDFVDRGSGNSRA